MTKRDLCREYLIKFPNTATKTLANIIYNENISVFNSAETVRGTLRILRGNAGVKNKKYKLEEFERPNGVSGNPFNLPESEPTEWIDFIIPESQKNVLILSDIHLPYHSMEALNLAIEYGRNHKVDTVVLNGDIIDFYQTSSFVRDPRKKSFSYELSVYRDFITSLKAALNDPVIYFKQGNHEERYERYMFLKAPELIGVEEFKLNVLLKFGENNIHYIDNKRISRLGGLAILHGHEFGRSVFSPVNPARGVYTRAKENTLIGHHHQTSEHTEPTLSGKVITTWSTGCLCELNPEYMPINKWNHGFAHVIRDGKSFEVMNKRIHKGKIF